MVLRPLSAQFVFGSAPEQTFSTLLFQQLLNPNDANKRYSKT
jgi:hypothetical protein